MTLTAQISQPWSNKETFITCVDTLLVVLEDSALNALGDALPTKPVSVDKEHRRLQAAAAAGIVAPVQVPAGGTSREPAGHKTGAAKGGVGGGTLSIVQLEKLYNEARKCFDIRDFVKARDLLLQVKNGSDQPYRNTQQMLLSIHNIEKLTAGGGGASAGAAACSDQAPISGLSGPGKAPASGTGTVPGSGASTVAGDRKSSVVSVDGWDSVSRIKSFVVYEVEEQYCDAMMTRTHGVCVCVSVFVCVSVPVCVSVCVFVHVYVLLRIHDTTIPAL